MTNKEKAILSKMKKALPKMSDKEKERLLIFGEAIGMIADKREEDGEQAEHKTPA